MTARVIFLNFSETIQHFVLHFAAFGRRQLRQKNPIHKKNIIFYLPNLITKNNSFFI